MLNLSKKKSKTYNLVFASFMLSLVIIFSIVSNFLPFPFNPASFLKIDLSVIFIFFTFYVSGSSNGIIILIISFLISPFLPGSLGIVPIFLVGKLINTISNFLFCFIALKILTKKMNYSYFYPIITSLLLTSFFMTFLNIIIFTPIFFHLIDNNYSLSFIDFANQYNQNKEISIFFFGIENYYIATCTLYLIFNLINYGIVSFSLIPTLKIIK
ncbi:MAG: MPN527 family putative ECF transporter permease subunit [Metamycoplasmataceae bacterium]